MVKRVQLPEIDKQSNARIRDGSEYLPLKFVGREAQCAVCDLKSLCDWDLVLQGNYEGVNAEDLKNFAEIVHTTYGRPNDTSRRSVTVKTMAATRRNGQEICVHGEQTRRPGTQA